MIFCFRWCSSRNNGSKHAVAIDDDDVTEALMVNNDRYIDFDNLETEDPRDTIHQFELQLPVIMANESFTQSEKQNCSDVLSSMKREFDRQDMFSNIDVLTCLDGASSAQEYAIKQYSHFDLASEVLKTKSSEAALENKTTPITPTCLNNQLNDEKVYAS